MVLTKTPLKKHRISAMTNLKNEGSKTISNEHHRKSSIKKTRSPDKLNKQKDIKMKSSTMKGSKIMKSASVTKKAATSDISKIPVPLSKSSTYKQVNVQKQKIVQKKKVADAQPPKQEYHINNSAPSVKADVNFVMPPKEKSTPHLEKFYQSSVNNRVKQIKKSDAENQKRLKTQYISSMLADMRKTDLETTLRKYAAGNENNEPVTDLKKKKRKSIKKKPSSKSRVSPRIVSETNEITSINSLKKDTPSMMTHFLEADSQPSTQIPAMKKHYKIVKQKKSPRAKQNADGKDSKSTQLTQHKKKNKSHTLKLNRVQSSDSVPNLPIREIKHNDSFVLSAKKLENSSLKRTTRYKKFPEHLKLKTKRPKSAHPSASKTAEPKSDSTKPEQLKSCLKKNWDENDFTAVNSKYEMNFGLVPLIVN